MNGSDAKNFWYFWKKYWIAFKRVVMNAETINGSVDTGEILIAQILNKKSKALSRKSADVAK